MRASALLVLVFPLAAAWLACSAGRSSNPPGGGGSGSGGSGGGSSGGGSGGSSSGGALGTCPGSQPGAGTTCPSPGLSCEYGTDPNLDCDSYEICDSSGHWTLTTVGKSTCPTHAPGTQGCAGTFATVPVGKACKPSALSCGYPEGRCSCTPQLSGPPTTGGNTPTWVCEKPAAGCPEPRAELGSPCPTDGQSCDYGSCILPGGTTQVCQNGSWSITNTACAN